jgi:serine/threonine-protein kinase
MPELVAGRYLPVRLLGAGGSADVWLAEDQALGILVALKLPRRERSKLVQAGDGSAVRRELAVARRLSHPNIVAVLDSGEVDGDPFIAFEYVDGPSLREALQQGPLPVGQVRRIGQDIAAALAHAHDRGILHNDIKPENILLAPDGAKLTDFGVAAGATTLTITSAAGFAGSLAYLAPEVLQGEAPSAASDQYGFALVLYEAACGRLPWLGSTPAAVAGQRLAIPAPPLASITGAPASLSPALDRALRARPSDRYPSVTALAQALTGPPAGSPARASRGAGGMPRRRLALAASGCWLLTIGSLVAAMELRDAAQTRAATAATTADHRVRDVDPAVLPPPSQPEPPPVTAPTPTPIPATDPGPALPAPPDPPNQPGRGNGEERRAAGDDDGDDDDDRGDDDRGDDEGDDEGRRGEHGGRGNGRGGGRDG